MKDYTEDLHIDADCFENMRTDADEVLQNLIKSMIEKESTEGTLSIKIDILLVQDFIENNDPNIEGETRKVLRPQIFHKVNSVMQIKKETKGVTNYQETEVVWDELKGEFVLIPIANTAQRSIFDNDFKVTDKKKIMALPMAKVRAY